MASTTYYLTDSANIANIEVSVGNLLFCEDTKRIYFDGTNGRICYDSIMVFQTIEEMLAYDNPYIGFYFVESEKTLWRYDGDGWIAITEPPKNVIMFIPESDLPEEGESEVLYVCGTKLFIWEDEQYKQINADSVWQEV